MNSVYIFAGNIHGSGSKRVLEILKNDLKFTDQRIELRAPLNRGAAYIVNLLFYVFLRYLFVRTVFAFGDFPVVTFGKQYCFLQNALLIDNHIDKSLNRIIKMLLFRMLSICVTEYIVQSNFMKSKLQKLFPSKKISVCKHNVLLKIPEKRIRLPDTYLVVTSDYLHKMNDDLLKIANLNPDIKIRVIGIDKVNEKNVTYLGQVSHNLVIRELTQCSGLLNFSFLESYGLTLVEAKLTETPVFSRRTDYAVEILNDTATYYSSGQDLIQKFESFKIASAAPKPQLEHHHFDSFRDVIERLSNEK